MYTMGINLSLPVLPPRSIGQRAAQMYCVHYALYLIDRHISASTLKIFTILSVIIITLKVAHK